MTWFTTLGREIYSLPINIVTKNKANFGYCQVFYGKAMVINRDNEIRNGNIWGALITMNHTMMF